VRGVAGPCRPAAPDAGARTLGAPLARGPGGVIPGPDLRPRAPSGRAHPLPPRRRPRRRKRRPPGV